MAGCNKGVGHCDDAGHLFEAVPPRDSFDGGEVNTQCMRSLPLVSI